MTEACGFGLITRLCLYIFHISGLKVLSHFFALDNVKFTITRLQEIPNRNHYSSKHHIKCSLLLCGSSFRKVEKENCLLTLSVLTTCGKLVTIFERCTIFFFQSTFI